MTDFTVLFTIPDMPITTITRHAQADDAVNACNAAAAKIILDARRQGGNMRPEDIVPIAVFAGRHANLLDTGQ